MAVGVPSVKDRQPPSVAHVLWSGEVGGIERMVLDLAREQARTGMRVAVAYGQPRGPFATAVRDAGIPVIDLDARSGLEVSPARILAGSGALRDFDVLHVHGFTPPLAAMVIAARRPTVFTEHGNFGAGRSTRLRDRPKRRLQRLFLRHATRGLAANSSYTRERFSDLYQIEQGDVRVIYNGVDFASVPPPSDLSDRLRPLTVAYVGRLAGFKRVDRLIEAVGLLPAASGVRVLVLGVGPLLADLRRLASEVDAAGRVQFLGARSDLDEVLGSADLLVHPSQGEPFGLAIVECCARGLLPVVFADAGGALEVIPPDAVVVTSVEDLAATLDGLDERQISFSARCARASWARDTFPIERTAAAYLDLYTHALAPRGAPA